MLKLLGSLNRICCIKTRQRRYSDVSDGACDKKEREGRLLTSSDSCLLLRPARGPDDGGVDDEVRGVFADTTEKVGHALPHVGLRMVQPREELGNDPCSEREGEGQ